MKLKGLVDEDIANYKKCSMFLIFPTCSFKCDHECGRTVCQNSSLANAMAVEVDKETVILRYVNNPMTSAIVCGGLEPFDSPQSLLSFVDSLRRIHKIEDDVVIYTGYTEEELENDSLLSSFYRNLRRYKNIIIKFGRFIPNQESHLDPILGVELASPNQYAKEVSEI